VAATLLVTLVTGQALRLSPTVGRTTALFAAIAGGASGVIAIAKAMHADEAVVVSVQYLRVVLVIFSVPLVAPFLGDSGVGAAAATDSGWTGTPFTLVTLLIGLTLARLIRFTASQLIVPMLVGVILSVTAPFGSSSVPDAFVAAGLGGIGLMVGLALTRATLARAVRVLPLALITCLLSIAGCALIGLALSDVAGVDAFSGYLATSPGGLSAVIAFAIANDADVGLVVTCQVLRLVLALGLGAGLGGYLKRGGESPRT
ncbi:MAG TPA: AbrB family transcriptional regulator, partial [Thermomicrobiales bacterium]|nr:AbrB family transcriptional regulator [Thermomicrobiales bacterium]